MGCSLREHLSIKVTIVSPRLQVLDTLKRFRQDWKCYVERMVDTRKALHYRPSDRKTRKQRSETQRSRVAEK